jgi:hypothetical protein
MSLPAGPAVGRTDSLDVGSWFAPVHLERSLDYFVNPSEVDAPREKGRYRGFIGSV